MTVIELVPSPEAGTPRTVPTVPTVRTVTNSSSDITTAITSTTVLRSGWPPVSVLDGSSEVALEQEAPATLDPKCGAEATDDPPAAVDTRHRTAALTGLGLVAVSLSLRAILFRHLDPGAPAPDLPVGGWSIAAALFPHGEIGAAAFVAQATILAAGLSAALQTGWFTVLDATGRRGAVALAVAGGLSLVPVVALTLVVAANAAAVALLVAGVVLVLRALA